MSAYIGFAELYDIFMDNIPYEEWGDYIEALLKEYNVNEGIVLDLGCGTGNITELLAGKGYDMIGIDNSYDMLNIAMEKREKSGKTDILYLCQDMREFELYGTVAAAVCVCDSLNYILEKEELVRVFKLVNNYLDPKGIFIFDLKTVENYKNIGDSTIAENREEGSFIWENYFCEEDNINEYNLTIFSKRENNMYEKMEELHRQRAYSIEEIKMSLSEAGMEFVGAYNAFTKKPVTEKSERIYIIARESGKTAVE